MFVGILGQMFAEFGQLAIKMKDCGITAQSLACRKHLIRPLR